MVLPDNALDCERERQSILNNDVIKYVIRLCRVGKNQVGLQRIGGTIVMREH